jgi:hypothetical protein
MSVTLALLTVLGAAVLAFARIVPPSTGIGWAP